jgi:hypothetical protein
MEPETAVHTQRRLLLFMSVDLAGSTAFKNTVVLGEGSAVAGGLFQILSRVSGDFSKALHPRFGRSEWA